MFDTVLMQRCMWYTLFTRAYCCGSGKIMALKNTLFSSLYVQYVHPKKICSIKERIRAQCHGNRSGDTFVYQCTYCTKAAVLVEKIVSVLNVKTQMQETIKINKMSHVPQIHLNQTNPFLYNEFISFSFSNMAEERRT